MTSVSEAVAARKSVRAFLPKEVPLSLLEVILSRASRAPSGGNVQPWVVHVVTGDALIRLRDAVKASMSSNPAGEGTEYNVYPPDMKEPYRARQRKVAATMYALLDIARDDKMGRLLQMAKNFDFFGAPAAVFFSIDREFDRNQWAHLGMFMQTFALLATEAGLATCMQEAWAGYHKTIAEQLSLSDKYMLYCGIAVGYEDTDDIINRLETERAPLEDFATFLS